MLKNQLLRHNSSYAPHNRVKHDKTMGILGIYQNGEFFPMNDDFFLFPLSVS